MVLPIPKWKCGLIKIVIHGIQERPYKESMRNAKDHLLQLSR
jgi:hypothetical protein